MCEIYNKSLLFRWSEIIVIRNDDIRSNRGNRKVTFKRHRRFYQKIRYKTRLYRVRVSVELG